MASTCQEKAYFQAAVIELAELQGWRVFHHARLAPLAARISPI